MKLTFSFEITPAAIRALGELLQGLALFAGLGLFVSF
jgi:hypothetical protein